MTGENVAQNHCSRGKELGLLYTAQHYAFSALAASALRKQPDQHSAYRHRYVTTFEGKERPRNAEVYWMAHNMITEETVAP